MKKLLEMIKKFFGFKSSSSSEKGFTLIELLIVMGVLGILAAAVLIAIDPLQQFARGRDSGRKDSVATLGRAVQNYYTSNLGFPADNGTGTWMTTLLNSGEIKVLPSTTIGGQNVSAPDCSIGGTAIDVQGGFCYKSNASNFIVYSHLESKIELNKFSTGGSGNPCNSQNQSSCGCDGVQASTWYIYSSIAGRAGTVCTTTEPSIAAMQFQK